MAATKTIAIVGATGNQGCSVAKTFLSLPNWRVRCLVRNASSEKAKALAAQGAEVVQADLSDVDSLVRAFDGAHAIFLLTDFWGTFVSSLTSGVEHDAARKKGYETEVQNAKNAAIAASRIPTLERLVYSALGPMKKASNGKFANSYHWEAKAAAVEYIESELPELAQRTSYLYPTAYATNAFLLPQRNAETGEYVLQYPGPAESHLPIVNERGPIIGQFVRALIEDEEPQTKLMAYDEDITIAQALEAWKKVTGKDARIESMSMEEMHKRTGLPYEVLDGAGFLSEYHYMTGLEGFIEPHHLKTKVESQSYEDFLRTRSSEELLESRFPKM